jgi:Domain of unknown function (DUF4411)
MCDLLRRYQRLAGRLGKRLSTRRVSLYLGKTCRTITDGVLKCSEEVYFELHKKDDGLHDWLKARKEVLVPINEEIQGIVSELLKLHPRLVDTFRNRSQADPFAIATAEYLHAIVVTGEKPRGKLDIPKIPDVCEARKIRCMSFLEMLRELGWSF